MRYRRAYVKGGTYFFTVNLLNRNHTLLVDHIDVLRKVMNRVKKRHPFRLDAMVVMPEHIHAIMTLPSDDTDYAKRWSLIKAGFSRHFSKHEKISESRVKKGERGIWQRRYWEHVIRDDDDLKKHIDYIHFNPVKHGYVTNPVDWPFSTIHRYIERGILSAKWGSNDRIDQITTIRCPDIDR